MRNHGPCSQSKWALVGLRPLRKDEKTKWRTDRVSVGRDPGRAGAAMSELQVASGPAGGHIREALISDPRAERNGLTPRRQIVLEALIHANRPLGAYRIMAQIETATGRRLLPSSDYRSLQALSARGLVTRIASKKAYLANAQPTTMQPCMYCICVRCGAARAIEHSALGVLTQRQAAARGFRVDERVVEMQGVCQRCRAVDVDHSLQISHS
jgi:Fur family transcriptional regulator, zinc uptake regulator